MPTALPDDRAGPNNAEIARHYDALDPFYRDVWGEHVHHGWWETGRESPEEATEKMSRRVLAGLALEPRAKVADIGCGYGGTARILAEARGAHVLGLTLSEAQKRHAETRAVSRGSVEIRVQDWKEAKFSAGEFDALFALESLEHIAEKAEFAKMAWRAVRTGGRVVVATWLRADRTGPWARKHLLDAICKEGRLPALATAGELREAFSAAGFYLVREEDLSRQVRRTWSVILRRLVWRLMTRPDYWKFLLNSSAADRVFAFTALRIWVAYGSGCFRYGFYVWERKGGAD